MDNAFLDIILALAVVVVPLGLAGLIMELQSRRDAARRREGR